MFTITQTDGRFRCPVPGCIWEVNTRDGMRKHIKRHPGATIADGRKSKPLVSASFDRRWSESSDTLDSCMSRFWNSFIRRSCNACTSRLIISRRHTDSSTRFKKCITSKDTIEEKEENWTANFVIVVTTLLNVTTRRRYLHHKYLHRSPALCNSNRTSIVLYNYSHIYYHVDTTVYQFSGSNLEFSTHCQSPAYCRSECNSAYLTIILKCEYVLSNTTQDANCVESIDSVFIPYYWGNIPKWGFMSPKLR